MRQNESVAAVEDKGFTSSMLVGRTVAPESLWARPLRRFRRHKLATVGLVVVVLMSLVALFAPWLAMYDPIRVDVPHAYEPPSPAHILGTDAVGRDIWSRLVTASRISMTVGLAAQTTAIGLAILIGVVAAYYGGLVDEALMRFAEIVMQFPGLILIIILVAYMGPSFITIMAVLGLVGWPGLARVLRSQLLSVRELDYVTAARVMGASNRRIMFYHVFPAVIPIIIVSYTVGVAGAVMAEAGLSFLGFGVPPPEPSWGNMLNEARNVAAIANCPWVWLPPGIAIFVLVLAVNFLGDGLRDALDPRMGID